MIFLLPPNYYLYYTNLYKDNEELSQSTLRILNNEWEMLDQAFPDKGCYWKHVCQISSAKYIYSIPFPLISFIIRNQFNYYLFYFIHGLILVL